MRLESFSEGYFIMDTRVEPYTGEDVVVAPDLLQQLDAAVGEPILKFDTGHYEPRAEGAVPMDMVAAPKYVCDEPRDSVLVAKPNSAVSDL
jgi:hypothetical protein